MGAVKLVEVEAGTVIKDELTDKEVIVTDTDVAYLGGCLYVTKAVFDRMRAAVPEEVGLQLSAVTQDGS